MSQTLLDLVYGAYVGGIIMYWHCATLWWDGPVKALWRTMTFKERMASLLCSSIILLMPAHTLYEMLSS